jgi:hypothetical protein
MKTKEYDSAFDDYLKKEVINGGDPVKAMALNLKLKVDKEKAKNSDNPTNGGKTEYTEHLQKLLDNLKLRIQGERAKSKEDVPTKARRPSTDGRPERPGRPWLQNL